MRSAHGEPVSVPSRLQLLREGWQRLGAFLPEMRQPRCAALIWGGFVLLQGGLLALGHLLAGALPYGALLVQSALVLWAGGWMYCGFWQHRAAYRQRYGALAYRQLFFRFLYPGLVGGATALVFPLCVGGTRLLPPVVAGGVVAYLLVTMELIEIRGKAILWNFDLRAFVYSVFPERGRIITAGTFACLRHPVYSAGMRCTIGLALIRNNASALLCAALIAAALAVLAHLEERDLQRNDPAYAMYRRRVPAFFHLSPLRFWRCLLAGQD